MAAASAEGRFRPQQRFRRRWSWGTVLFFSLLALIAVRRGCESVSPNSSPPLETLVEGTYDVVRVVDGDTLIVRPATGRGGFSDEAPQARVRLLGIDTPETVKPDHPVEPWGKEAAEFAQNFLSGGEVELRFDRRRKDRYDRFLAYVFVGDEMLNEALVRAGLARISHYPGDSPQIARRLKEAEAAAKQEGVGIWSD